MIKYTIPYRSYDDVQWRVDIDMPGYAGEPIFVNGAGNNVCTLDYESDIDDVWESSIINTKATIKVLNTGQIDVDELQLVKDRDCRVTVYRNDQIKFAGYLIADNMQRVFLSAPYEVTISATSGLNLLSAIDYLGFGGELGDRVPLNYFRRILQSTWNLGVDLPIRWSTRLTNINPELAGDAFEKLIWSARGEGFSQPDPSDPVNKSIYKSCEYIIEGIAKALQCRVFQADGAWWVVDIMNSIEDVLSFKECINSTGIPIISEYSNWIVREIGSDYPFIREDGIITVKPALSQASVTYQQDQRENILPNGNMDIWSLGLPLYWSFSGGLMNEYDSITQRKGRAVELWNTSGDPAAVFKLSESLPIDANILYSTLSWGFSFMPVSGFDQDGDTLNIKWPNNPIKTSIKYTLPDGGTTKDYYLNEFGYWSDKNLQANAQVTGILWSPAQGGRLDIQFDNAKSFFSGDEVVISFVRNGSIETYNIPFTETMDVESGLDYIVSKIPNSANPVAPAGGIYILQVTNDIWNQAYTQKFRDWYKYIYFTVDNIKLMDIAAIEFNSRLQVKIPDPGVLNQNTDPQVGKLSIEFILTGNQRYVLDDIWMNVDTNSDKYVASVSNDKNANSKEYSLSISSSFNGFYVSNFMQSFGSSNEDYLFDDDGNIGSLTHHYARSVMKFRSKPSRIFNGSINVRGKDWSYLDNYIIPTLAGKYIPLNPRYNTETNEVLMVAIEARNEEVDNLTVTHFGSEQIIR